MELDSIYYQQIFKGQGVGTLLKLEANANCTMFAWTDTSEIVSGIIFMDMQFDGNYDNNTSGSVWENTAVGPGGTEGYVKDGCNTK